MIKGLGIDIVEIKRFRKFKSKSVAFLKKVFTKNELYYCFSFSDLTPHLAGIFSAKEAIVKASGSRVSILDIEIRHRKNGQPEVFIKSKKIKNILVSISHTEKIACAIAICL